MGSTQFGNFGNFCRDSFLPICNILLQDNESNQPPGTGYNNSCVLYGIPLGNNRYLANLGSIILAGIGVFITLFLLWRSERKAAAVGRREMQLFLLGYLVIAVCEIFTVGGIPLDNTVRKAFTAVHIAAITTTVWWLMLNAFVGFQIVEDGTALSMILMLVSGILLFVGTGYVALDTAFHWTKEWDSSFEVPMHRNIALYVLYQLAPLVFLVIYFFLETYLVLRVLGEVKPMLYLVAAAVLFIIGQVFMYVISIHVCRLTAGKINGTLFETLFTLLSVIMIWIFWSSITEDDWPAAV